MEDKTVFKKVAMTYGLYMGLTSIVLAVIQYVTGIYDISGQSGQQWISMLLGLAVTVTFVILAFNKYKAEGDGYLNFGEGFKLSFTTIIYSILISIVWLALYIWVLEPDYQDQIMQGSYDKLISQGLEEGTEGFDMAMSMTEKMTSPIFMLLLTIVNGAIFGAIISLIMAAFFKNKRPEFMPPADNDVIDNE